MDTKSASKRIGFSWAGDVADCIVSNINHKRTHNEIFNIGTAENNSVSKLVETITNIAQELGLVSLDFHQSRLKTNHVDIAQGKFDKIFNVMSWKHQTEFYDCIKKFIVCKYGSK